MTILDSTIRTLACDAPGCTKQVIFDHKEAQTVLALPENVWVKGHRIIVTADNRNFAYCSDICEVKGIETGKHNVLEAPKVVPVGNAAAIAAAAQAAAQARQTDAAIRSGQTAKVQITD